MTSSSTRTHWTYRLDGHCRTFGFGACVHTLEELSVTWIDGMSQRPLCPGQDFHVAGIGHPEGGSITLTDRLEAGDLVIRHRPRPGVVSSVGGPSGIDPVALDRALARLAMIDAHHGAELSRTLRLPETDANEAPLAALPRPVAGAFLRWSVDGRRLVQSTPEDFYCETGIESVLQTVLRAGHVAKAAKDELVAAVTDGGTVNVARRRSDVVELSAYLAEDQQQVTLRHGRVVAGRDCSEAFERALHDAQRRGQPLYLGNLNVLLAGRTITPLPGDLRIHGAPDGARVYSAGFAGCDRVKFHDLWARTQFHWQAEPQRQSAEDRPEAAGDRQPPGLWNARIDIAGIEWVNLDTDATARLFCIPSPMRSLSFERCRFTGYTNVVGAGLNRHAPGQRGRARALTAIESFRVDRVVVVSNQRPAGQCSRFYCIKNAADVDCSAFAVYSYGGIHGPSYNTRIDGGGYETVPQVGQGASNVRIRGYHAVSDNREAEYNQIAKCTNVTLVNCTGDATAGFAADNMWDLFDCLNVSLTGHTVWGSGLAFFGHADLGHAEHRDGLIGARVFVASANTVIDCEHEAVFNPGGDGTVNAHRAGGVVRIADNQVYDRPGYAERIAAKEKATGLKRKSARVFVYAFIVDGLDIVDNTVTGLEGFYRSYYVANAVITGNTVHSVVDMPMRQWVAEGVDAHTRPTAYLNHWIGRFRDAFDRHGAHQPTLGWPQMRIATARADHGRGDVLTLETVLPPGAHAALVHIGIRAAGQETLEALYSFRAMSDYRHDETPRCHAQPADDASARLDAFEITLDSHARLVIRHTGQTPAGWHASAYRVM